MTKDLLAEMLNEPSSVKEKKSDFMKIGVGDTKLRVLTSFEPVYKLYKGEYPNNEFVGYVEENKAVDGHEVRLEGWAWVIERSTGEVKLLTVGRGILKLLAQLRSNDEYAFDEFPMPYDITIKNTGDGPNRYSITAARKNTPITEAETALLAEKTPVSEIISKMKEKAAKGQPNKRSYPTPEEEGINVDEVGF